MPVIESNLPRVVTGVDSEWRDLLQNDTSYEFEATKAAGSDLYTISEARIDAGGAFAQTIDCNPAAKVRDATNPAFWELLRTVEKDAKAQGLFAKEAQVVHDLTIRTGVANMTSFGQSILKTAFPRLPHRFLFGSVTHVDANVTLKSVKVEPLYTIVHGKPTNTYGGRFWLHTLDKEKKSDHHEPGELLCWLALRLQTLVKRSTTQPSNHLVQADTLNVHNMPGLRLDPDNPRVFLRDVVYEKVD